MHGYPFFSCLVKSKRTATSGAVLLAIVKFKLVHSIDVPWNTIEPSLVLMYRKLADLDWVYFDRKIHILEPETEKTYFHNAAIGTKDQKLNENAQVKQCQDSETSQLAGLGGGIHD